MSSYEPKRLLVCGGAGFIGSAYVLRLIADPSVEHVTVLDKLTYAGNLANLARVRPGRRFQFIQGDIADRSIVETSLAGVDSVVNFAAETHVDRSIYDANAFVRTDVLGLQVLLEACLTAGIRRVLQVSTDEVYGHVEHGSSTENDLLVPRSPYAASKASGDLVARAYYFTHGLPVVITRGSNTFGPRQHPEKMMPLFITNALDSQLVPVYGDGQQVREWISVDDHCAGINTALRSGISGEIYNVGSGNSRANLDVAKQILALCGQNASLINHVRDRKGHDRRYALDSSKLRALGWRPEEDFSAALADTVTWYANNQDWWRPLKVSQDFAEHSRRTYASTPDHGL